MSGFIDEYSEFGDDGAVTMIDMSKYEYASDILIGGDSNSPPVISDRAETSVGSVFDSFRSIMGSIGTTARDVGTAVGTIKRDIKGAKQNFKIAEKNAATGNALGQWWAYSTTQDKLMIGLALAGIALVLVKR